MRLGLFVGLLTVLFWGCESTPEEGASLAEQREALAIRSLSEASWRNAQCGCGEDFECRVLCDYGEAEMESGGRDQFDLPGLAECPMCGRETGFLDAPELEGTLHSNRGGVHLEWSPVENAAFYVVHAIQLEDVPKIVAMRRTDIHQLEETEINLKLTPGYRYVFFVIAWSDGEVKRRSEPSEPIGFVL